MIGSTRQQETKRNKKWTYAAAATTAIVAAAAAAATAITATGSGGILEIGWRHHGGSRRSGGRIPALGKQSSQAGRVPQIDTHALAIMVRERLQISIQTKY